VAQIRPYPLPLSKIAPYLNDVKALGLDVCVTTVVFEQAASRTEGLALPPGPGDTFAS
jgi:hypothetical protein